MKGLDRMVWSLGVRMSFIAKKERLESEESVLLVIIPGWPQQIRLPRANWIYRYLVKPCFNLRYHQENKTPSRKKKFQFPWCSLGHIELLTSSTSCFYIVLRHQGQTQYEVTYIKEPACHKAFLYPLFSMQQPYEASMQRCPSHF